MTPLVKLDDVSKQYGRTLAVDQLSLEVPPGVVFALLGENGAGKSTTLRMLMGLEQPTRGKSTVLGLDSARQGAEIRRRCGYLPELPVLYD
ncbi:MAG: ATP-binding cassette domain-containing protein, partial [Planctomycetota bacterium]